MGVNGGYVDDDVVAVARLLTGWTINPSTREFQFRADLHDGGALRIMGWTRPIGGDPQQDGVVTEFGRRLAENGSGGTDHGFGSVMLALGERVKGGSVLGAWPGLSAGDLVRGDLPGHTHKPVGLL